MASLASVPAVARDIIVVGASAGGVTALQTLFQLLPSDLPAAMFVVLHRPAVHNPSLPDLLGKRAALPIVFPADGERFVHGRIYLGPPGQHMLVERGLVRLEPAPKEIFSRPSVDALFRSAAEAYGRRVVGVVLTGSLSDGTVGLWQIKKRGGVSIVQDPTDAEYPDMPRNAATNVPIDHCLPLAMIAGMLTELARQSAVPRTVQGTRPGSVLVVEDERIVARDMEKRLVELGYVVCGNVASGEAAIQMAAEANPDVVLMDIRLAGAMSGTEAATQIWQRFQIPVVYVTAFSDAATLDEIKSSEPYGYVMKPLRAQEVHAAIQLALDRRDKETRDG